MLFKQKDYDEFVAKKIAQAEQSVSEGRVVSFEQFEQNMERFMARKAEELEQSEKELVIYG